MIKVDRLAVKVAGRPAPQGSKARGAHGQMREASPYLPAWRAAVKRAVYAAYLAAGVEPETLPLFVGPVAVRLTFWLAPGRRVDAAPDLDKMIRATWDVLTQARAIEDDGRIVSVVADKRHAGPDEPTGADIEVWPVGEPIASLRCDTHADGQYSDNGPDACGEWRSRADTIRPRPAGA